MNPQKKAFLIGLILVGGLLLALPFRHSSTSERDSQSSKNGLWLTDSLPGPEQPDADSQPSHVSQVNLRSPVSKRSSDASSPNSLNSNFEESPGSYSDQTLRDLPNSGDEPLLDNQFPEGLERIERRPVNSPTIADHRSHRDARDENPSVADTSNERQLDRSTNRRPARRGEIDSLPNDVVAVQKPFVEEAPQRSSRSDAGSSRNRELRPAEPRVIRHTVRDGDTLQSLARRYLGDSRRGLEIYKSNRSLLSNPSVLPIGEELYIVVKR